MCSALGVALFVVVLIFLKDHRVLQRYTYISMVVALVLLLLPLVPGLGVTSSAPGSGSRSPASASHPAR